MIYAIEIGSEYIRLNPSNVNVLSSTGGKAELIDNGLKLTLGTDVWIEIQIDESLSIGSFMEIKVYTSAGYVHRGILIFK